MLMILLDVRFTKFLAYNQVIVFMASGFMFDFLLYICILFQSSNTRIALANHQLTDQP